MRWNAVTFSEKNKTGLCRLIDSSPRAPPPDMMSIKCIYTSAVRGNSRVPCITFFTYATAAASIVQLFVFVCGCCCSVLDSIIMWWCYFVPSLDALITYYFLCNNLIVIIVTLRSAGSEWQHGIEMSKVKIAIPWMMCRKRWLAGWLYE